MTLDEYQEKALRTAMYEDKITYPALKLIGETGEVCEKLGKILRDQYGLIGIENKKQLAKELGDVMWYVAVLTHDVGFKLSNFGLRRKEEDVNKLFADETIHQIAVRMANFAVWTSMKAIVFEKHTKESCRKKDVAIGAGTMIEFIQRLALMIDYNLDDIMEMNVGKLQSRFIRRKIKGSGDDR